MSRPSLVLYCQHSLGLGHLSRSWRLAGALSEHFRVTVWCGGPLPQTIGPPASCDIVAFPPLVVNEEGRLVSLDARYTADQALELRRDTMLHYLATERPAALVIELFPFGRKKFESELLPLLDAARAISPRPIVACSLRDILVRRGDGQMEHDERARLLAERYFDAVLVHADPAFARLDESFRPAQPMRIPVHYTGFVTGRPPVPNGLDRSGILVSGGGGRFAGSLFMSAIEAHRHLTHPTTLTIVAGPLCGASLWQRLVAASRGNPLIDLRHSVTDLSAEMAASRLSISQCGYNTALDIVRVRVPAIVVPFAESGETEQTDRARRLEKLGVLRVLPADRLDAASLAQAIEKTLDFEPAPLAFDLDGANRTSQLMNALIRNVHPTVLRRATVHERLA